MYFLEGLMGILLFLAVAIVIWSSVVVVLSRLSEFEQQRAFKKKQQETPPEELAEQRVSMLMSRLHLAPVVPQYQGSALSKQSVSPRH